MQGHRFSIGVVDEAGVVHGAVIVGRPVGRAYHPREFAEVTRLVTDGTPNACSMLYAAAARACRAMGFSAIQTYILESETGTSLKAAGWLFAGTTQGDTWARPNRVRIDKSPTVPKGRWVLTMAPDPPTIEDILSDPDLLDLGLSA
jgi:hypothetical protein